MAENLNATQFPQQSNFRPLRHWRLILVWAMFFCDEPIKSLDEERQLWGGIIERLGGYLWASRDHRHRTLRCTCLGTKHASMRVWSPATGWFMPQLGMAEEAKPWAYRQSRIHNLLYLGVRAVHFDWLCSDQIFTLPQLSCCIQLWTPVMPYRWWRNK